MDNKTEGNDFLLYTPKNAWERSCDNEKNEANLFCEGYKTFIDRGKTEREFALEVEKLAKSNGFIDINELIATNTEIKPGMKIYRINKKKSAALCVVGNLPLENGINIIGSHIDSPRIDLKQNPLYEDNELAMLKTHYYGGIKKYQWLTIPLTIHGVVVKINGEVVEIKIGEDEADPVFTITDLLPHLAQDQMQKKMSEAITGEGLNILIGSIPVNEDKSKDKVKLNILKLLNQKYGMVEEDFISAELEIVPAFKARDVGIDRSMVGAYGQDDRVCAYSSLLSLIDADNIQKTGICILTDKEEIGSVGNTGAESLFFENFLMDLMTLSTNEHVGVKVRRCLTNSFMLSADVNPGVDPNYESVYDKRNASFLGRGLVLQKYTGVRGKVGGSDANAEYIGKLRKLFNDNNIIWQSAELGKVDQGGGGTIAQYIANLGVEVIDCGVAILSMHSPFEITSKIDIYTSYKAYKIFYAMP